MVGLKIHFTSDGKRGQEATCASESAKGRLGAGSRRFSAVSADGTDLDVESCDTALSKNGHVKETERSGDI